MRSPASSIRQSTASGARRLPGGFHQRLLAAHRPSARRRCTSGSSAPAALVCGEAHARQHDERLQHVVVPVRWPVRRQPFGIDRLTGRQRPVQAVIEEQLCAASRRRGHIGIAGGGGVLVQTPDRRQGLMEAGPTRPRPTVAVPAAIGPLPLEEAVDQEPDALVIGGPEPAGHRQRVALLRGASSGKALDHRHGPAVGGTGDPAENLVEGRHRARLPGGNPELDERDESPVPADPLVVRVTAEAAVGLLPVEQSAHDRPLQDV
jgi:hypothetical protein